MEKREKIKFPKGGRGFTLVEIMVTLLISSAMFIGIVGLINFNFVYQDQQELRAGAMDEMAHHMEQLKRGWSFYNRPYTITVSDNRTPDTPDDDTLGVLTVRLFDREGNLLAEPSPTDRTKIVMTLTWNGAGALSTRTFRESLVGYRVQLEHAN